MDQASETDPVMIEGPVDQPHTPEWWLMTLQRAMYERRYGRLGRRRFTRNHVRPSRVRPGLDLLHDYLVGDPPLVGYAEGWGDHFRVIARLGRLNPAELIVNAKSARMKLQGFQTSAQSDKLGDQLARSIMRANNYKVKAREVHDFQLWAADGYMMVQPLQDGDKYPIITAEDPRQTVTAHDAATGRTLAALKTFRDDWDARDDAHLYIRQPDGKYRHFPLAREGASVLAGSSFRYVGGWELTDDPIDLPRCPIIRFQNRGGRGEYERHLDTLDRINDQVMDKVVIAKVQAFRQMVLKGLPDKELKVGPDGKAIEEVIDYSDAFVAEPGSLWRVPAGVDIWESAVTDIGPLRLAIKDDLQHLAAVTQTSLPAITPDASQGSAEGAALMREEEVFAVEACCDYAGGSHSLVMDAAFAFMADPEANKRADVTMIEPLWGPVERYSLQERADAASKAPTSLPIDAIRRDIWQYEPAELDELRQMEGASLLFQPTPTRVTETDTAATAAAPTAVTAQDGQGGPATA